MPPWIGPGRTRATSTTMSSKQQGWSLGSICAWARLSTWKQPIVSARLQQVVDRRVVQRQVIQVEGDPPLLADVGQRLVDHAQRAQAQQVDLDQPGVLDAVLVPLDHHPAGHRRPLQRHDLDQRRGGDQHPADVDGEVAGDAVHLAQQLGQGLPGEGRGQEVGMGTTPIGRGRLDSDLSAAWAAEWVSSALAARSITSGGKASALAASRTAERAR